VRIAYYDEAGDDGFPHYSSPLFALAAVYMHYLQWRPNFDRVQEFRRALRKDFGIPVKLEIHTKYFVLGKNLYRSMGLPEADRLQVMDLFADLIGSRYIPSHFGTPSRREITTLIEDPIQKDSTESYFIQLADFVSFVVYLYAHFRTGVGKLHGRMPTTVDQARVKDWVERMRPSLNTKAAGDDEFGVKIYPR
jgi:hypothetical protein